MPLIIPNSFSLFEEEAMSLDLDSIVNTDPVVTVGSRRYDIIYTSVYYNVPHLYALEYNGNEKALARLRKILALHPDSDETAAIFITKHKEPVDEESVKEYAMQVGSDYYNYYSEEQRETDQTTIHFHLLEGKIPESYGSLDDDSADRIPPHQLIAELLLLVQPWI
ncbi:unnamed protein product [Rotaria sordida]|uniref:Uncharacterized protein n=1 Tax=Rotaria sordida TaxID=392033 RepID=A0A815F4F5_9BILA|nr:unnamed protein product [Rotaria sordida]CAF3576048.1 unnamed protein product [Rotaria sordida]